MFTGIVEETGEIREVDAAEDGRRLRIATSLDGFERGQSLAVSGVCLTVEAVGEDWVSVFLATETVERTYLGELAVGDRVNLERAVRADDRLDGHIVQGHVDGTGRVTALESIGEDWELTVTVPETLRPYLVEKGSIAVDGISLTVADLAPEGVSIAIIPETYEQTTLATKTAGDPVHLEVDVVAKYVEQLVDEY